MVAQLSLWLVALASVAAQSGGNDLLIGPPPGVLLERNLVYAAPDGVELRLDLARPEAPAGPLPAVICIHGGSWRRGQREMCAPMMFSLAREGYVAVSISYRLAPSHRFPAPIEDLNAAIRWLRANAGNHSVDPKRIGLFGVSAGGHLALMAACADAHSGHASTGAPGDPGGNVQAVVSYAGPTNLAAEYWQRLTTGMFVEFIGQPYGQAPELYRQASPIEHVDGRDPPVLIFHGSRDLLVPLEQSEQFVEKMTAAGGTATLHVVQDAGHLWAKEKIVDTRLKTIAFFDEHLRNRPPLKKPPASRP